MYRNRRVIGAQPQASEVDIMHEPERFNYQEYGGYYEDKVGRSQEQGRDQR